jgi:hypothetical protein
MARDSGAAGEAPAFPPALLKDLREAAPQGARLRLITAGGQNTAIPWHALVRADTVRPDAGRAVGFRAE